MLDPSQLPPGKPSRSRARRGFQDIATDLDQGPSAERYLELCGIRLVKTLTIDWDNPRSVSEQNLSGSAAD
jgi:hypothetical protein